MNSYFKWFLKLALFALLFAIIDVGFGLVMKSLEKRTEKQNPKADKTSYLLHQAQEDVLIIGASEVEFSYRPDILADSLGLSVYNCGQNGQRLYYQTVMVNTIIDRYSPKLIIWSVSPRFLTPHVVDMEYLSRLKPYYRENKYCKYILQSRSKYEKYKTLSSLYNYNGYVLGRIMNAFDKKVDKMNGYKVIGKSKELPILEHVNWDFEPEELSINLFDETLKHLKQCHVRTVFVFSPNYSYGDYHASADYRILREKIEENGFDLIEEFYHNPSLMNAELFKDKDHLTEKGVELYTPMIAHEIKQLLNEE